MKSSGLMFVSLMVAAFGVAVWYSGCSSTTYYTPYISMSRFELNGECVATRSESGEISYDCGCVSDFSSGNGRHFDISSNGAPDESCNTRIYLDADDDSLDIVLYNAIMPCFPDEVLDGLLELQSDGDIDYESEYWEYVLGFGAGLVAASEDGVPAHASSIQLKEIIYPTTLLKDTMCSYTLRAKIEKLSQGSYKFKLWDYLGRPITLSNGKTESNEVNIDI